MIIEVKYHVNSNLKRIVVTRSQKLTLVGSGNTNPDFFIADIRATSWSVHPNWTDESIDPLSKAL
jgi:hypothetical protein